jgi:signal transduction histidine kinase
MLRSRITFFFCGYLAVLLALYTATLSGMLKYSEDLAFSRQLSEIAGRIVQNVEEHGEIPIDLPMHITAYPGLLKVPPRLQDFVKNHEPGIFEINADDFDYHAALVPIPSTGQMLYVFFDVASIEATERFQSLITLAVAGIGLGVLLIGWALARSVSNRILNPVSELAKVVQRLSLKEDTVALRSYSTPDEVGTLAETINQLLKRIAEFTRREREFTSHASHELRTPVTIIKGALEVIRSRVGEKEQAIHPPLARIERAVTNIELLIDTFLLLARQGDSPDKDETCDLKAVVKQVVTTYEYLLKAKPVEVSVQAKDYELIQAPLSLVKIALGNLVRNAFQYTMRGKVEILILADGVSVIDSGPGIDASRQAGIGLTIVERLCENMNWQFIITSTPDEGTRADLIFISRDAKQTEEKDCTLISSATATGVSALEPG